MSKEQPGNQTADTPQLSETELRAMTVDELRRRAKEEGVASPSGMRKDDLVEAISKLHRPGGRRADSKPAETEPAGSEPAETEPTAHGGGAGEPGDAGPEGGRLRTGDRTSKSLRYSQEVTSPDDEPERPGRSLATTNHEVIRQWAEARGAVPATVAGTEHDDRAGVLRFDFGGDSDRLEHISWQEWFATFDERGLNFLYQEERKDGRQSNFFRLENPAREDA